MHPCWPKEKVTDVVDLIREIHGLDVSHFDENFFLQSLNKRVSATSTATPELYLELLKQDAVEAKILFKSMDIIYSEFFRNSLAFAMLEQILLPELIDQKEKSGKSEIRIWSAGCATGQEAWSIAMLLDDLIETRSLPLSYRIIATDRSESVVSQARTGCYGIDALGNLKTKYLHTSFTRQGDYFDIIPRIRHRVIFTVYDLLDTATNCPPESIYGNFDLVFCCNVLFYYKHKIQTSIIKKIQRSLAPSGYLITDATERHIVEKIGGFRPLTPPAAVFTRY